MKIEDWPIAKIIPYNKNPRKRGKNAVTKVAASIREFGWRQPIVVDELGVILVGHTRLDAAIHLGMKKAPVHQAMGLSEQQKTAYRIADNRTNEENTWDDELLSYELKGLEGFDVSLTALDAEDIPAPPVDAKEEAPLVAVPSVPTVRAGEVWQIGPHKLLCGDCRDAQALARLFGTQRDYDASSGFQPIPPDGYASWFREVAEGIRSVLAADGSYFLNIKAHAEDGERSLYVMDLVLTHQRDWGWRFVDEFCWRKTDDGVPGGWPNRFKNAWEPVFHFCQQQAIKFRPHAVGHASEDCFDYSPNNTKSHTGSGLLGGIEGSRSKGIARPSNVLEIKSETAQGSHSAPFPRALVEFFVNAFSDVGDVIYDPFLGSGTTLAAAHVLGRVGYGMEISPGYCDVILARLESLMGQKAERVQ